MTTSIIITICVLLLLAYVFDISAGKTRIPSVILLLILGWLVGQLTKFSGINLPDLTPALPLLGTVGLILIVLEGALELELNRTKFRLIGKSFLMAVIPLFLISFGLAFCFQHFGGTPIKTGLVNAIPLAIISSAIAIPTARNLSARFGEFVVYESSLSDIVGVLFFNFVMLNEHISGHSFAEFFLDLGLLLLITLVATFGLAFLLSKIKHHVKFMPIILIVILIYAVSKVYHLPGLLFILILGLFIGNLDELKKFPIVQRLHPEIMNRESRKFKDIITEITFLIRALFFLLFGYLIQTDELLNPNTFVWAIAITGSIFVLRFMLLKLLRMPARPLLFIAPRGLITILLFLSIPVSQAIGLVNKSLIIQVVILTALVMMIGMITNKNKVLSTEKTVGEADESANNKDLSHNPQ